MTNSFKILILLFFLSFSCDSDDSFVTYQNHSGNETHIDVEEIPFQQKYVLDSLLEIIKVLKLESGDDIFIGSYDKILLNDDVLCIMDNKITHSIFSFDQEGNFLFKISNLGEGPDEYLEIRDFTISNDSETLDLLDFGGRKILKYNKKNGELVETIRIDRGTYIYFRKK